MYNGNIQYSICPASASVLPEMTGTCHRWLQYGVHVGLKQAVGHMLWSDLAKICQGYYVEVGTQSGEQCNTRYLRVRYGFQGLMVDDNFQNTLVNQKRRRLILSIHCLRSFFIFGCIWINL